MKIQINKQFDNMFSPLLRLPPTQKQKPIQLQRQSTATAS